MMQTRQIMVQYVHWTLTCTATQIAFNKSKYKINVNIITIVFILIQLLDKFPTSDWINSMDTADIDGDGVQEAVIGCMDSTLHCVKFSLP